MTTFPSESAITFGGIPLRLQFGSELFPKLPEMINLRFEQSLELRFRNGPALPLDLVDKRFEHALLFRAYDTQMLYHSHCSNLDANDIEVWTTARARNSTSRFSDSRKRKRSR